MEASPEDLLAWMVTRGRAKKLKEKDPGEAEDEWEEDEDTDQELVEVQKKRGVCSQTEGRPGQLVVLITRENMNRNIKGYLKDPTFEGHWKESPSTVDELIMGQWFYKNKDSLLFFQDADWKAHLCVPHSIVTETLQDHHESAWEMVHMGAACLYHCLTYCYYWPSMWRDIQWFCHSCDICQKIKPDLWGKKGLLWPHQIPVLPWDVISLDLITGLPWSHGYDAILVIVDKLSKYALSVPTTSTLSQSRFVVLSITC